MKKHSQLQVSEKGAGAKRGENGPPPSVRGYTNMEKGRKTLKWKGTPHSNEGTLNSKASKGGEVPTKRGVGGGAEKLNTC